MRKLYSRLNAFARLFAFPIVFLLLFNGSVNAQMPYTRTVLSGQTYTPIAGGTVINTTAGLAPGVMSQTQDDGAVIVTLPFTFSYAGNNFTQATFCTNGWVGLGDQSVVTAVQGRAPGNLFTSTLPNNTIAAWFKDMGANFPLGTGAMVHGMVGPDEYAFEWQNAIGNGFTDGSTNTINFMIKLYGPASAQPGRIEILYGPSSGTVASTAAVGIENSVGGTNNYINALDGTGTSTTQTASATWAGDGTGYQFDPLPACSAPTTQPTLLTTSGGYSAISGSFTAASPAVDKYLVVRTPAATALNTNPVNGTTYTVGGTLGNGTIVSYGPGTTFFASGLTANTGYTFTVFAANDFCTGGPSYNTAVPLTGTASTTNFGTAYSWNATSGSADAAVASNWTPNRTIADPSDTLYFNQGGSSTITNLVSSTVAKIGVTNNTTIIANSSAAATLSIAKNLTVDAGSTLDISGTNNLSVAFSSTGAPQTSTIAGTLNISGTGTNSYSATNSVTTVTGTVNITNANGSLTGSATTLFFNGSAMYVHARNGGTIPTAAYAATSLVKVTGVVGTVVSPPVSIGGSVEWNCPSQTLSAASWTSSLTSIGGTFTMVSTGTGSFQFGTSPAVAIAGLTTVSGGTLLGAGGTLTMNGGLTITGGTISGTSSTTINVNGNFAQSGGTITSSSTTANILTINTTGAFNQTAGTISESSTGSLAIKFTGTSQQAVTLSGTNTTGIINYTIANGNNNGIALTGTMGINNGATLTISIDGTPITGGTLAYNATSSTLAYVSSTTGITPTANEWPASGGSTAITVNLTGAAPNNRLTLHGVRTIAATGKTFTLTSGVIVLGANDLTIGGGTFTLSTPSATKMIATNATGQLVRAVSTTASTTYLFPVGDITATAEYSPVSLTMVANAAARNIGVRVINAHDPNDASVDYLNRYWAFTDDGGANAYTYNGTFTYVAADVNGTESNMRLSRWNGVSWNQVPSTLVSPVYTIAANQSQTSAPLNGSEFTGRTLTSTTYVWQPTSGSADFQVSTNWLPNRTVADATDVLSFTNAGTSTATNIPAQTVGQIVFGNNTQTNFQAAAANTLTIAGLTGTDLDIASGSSLIINGTNALTLVFSGSGNTANVSGTLEVSNTTGVNIINFANSVTTIATGGVLAAGGTVTTSGLTGTAATLIINGTYQHKYTTVVGTIPTATWNTNSTVLISGYTTATAGPSAGITQSFYNFTWNCSAQAANINLSGTVPTTVTGTFSLVSTGAGANELRLSGSTAYTASWANFTQSGGILDLANGAVAAGTAVINITGAFNQTAGTIKATGTVTTGSIGFNFIGTSGIQNANFFNAAPVGPVTYKISNAAGVNLTGSGTLTTNFNINSGGGVRISTTGATPLTSTLNLVYSAGTTLTYDAAGSYSMTAKVFPATSGPANLTINVGSGNVITMPASFAARSLSPAGASGILTMTSGDIDLNSNALTLGTSATFPGTLTWTAGSIRVTTGTFTRWYATTGLPAAAGTTVGYYPLAYGASNRNVSIFGSAQFTTGGTITVSHANVAGYTSVSIADGAYTVQKRTNSSWSLVAADGLALAGSTMGLRLTGGSLINTSTIANLRIVQASAAAGTHSNGTGSFPNVQGNRTTLALADLANVHYLGASNADVQLVYNSIATGNWSDPNTWDVGGTTPTSSDVVNITTGTNVSLDGANAAVNVNVATGGTLTALTGSLITGTTLVNNGTLNVTGATVTTTTSLTNAGTVNVTGGQLTTTTSMTNNSASTITVNGGAVYITTTLSNSGTINATSGTLNVTGASASGVTNTSTGTFNVNGATVNIGITNNTFCNRTFTNSGTLNVSSGVLNIFGNLDVAAAAFLTQSGGQISVDGNAAGVAANSVASGTYLVNIAAPSTNVSFTGGTFTIVDPSTNTSQYALYTTNSSSSPINALTAHTFKFGDGVSTDAGSTDGFYVDLWPSSTNLAFGNLTIEGQSSNATTRYLKSVYTLVIRGNLVVNSGGEYRPGVSTHLAGNLTVNAGATATFSAALFLDNYDLQAGSTTTVVNPQTIGGSGTYRNSTTTSTANFSGVNVNNSSGAGVTISSDLSYSGALTFVKGNLNTGTYKLVGIAGASVSGAGQSTGWVVGNFQKNVAAGVGVNKTFEVGNSTTYRPVVLAFANVGTAGDVIATTTAGEHPQVSTSGIDAAKSVNVNWTLTNSITTPVGFDTYSATFTYAAVDVDAGANTANFVVRRYNGGTWSTTTTGTLTATTSQATGVTSFGDFAIGETTGVPTVSTQPSNSTICQSTNTSFTSSSTSLPATTVAWERSTDGTTWVPVNGTLDGSAYTNFTTGTLTITGAAVTMNGYLYRAVFTNINGSVSSTPATLTVNANTSISSQPSDPTPVCINGTAPGVSVTAAGGNGTYTYQWYSNTSNSNSGGTLIPSATSATYTVPVTAAGTTYYYVVVTGNCGSAVTSNTAAMVVFANTSISTQPVSPSAVCINGTAPNISVTAVGGNGTYTYQWYSNTTNSNSGGTLIPSATNSSYTAPVNAAGTAYYYVVVTGSCGSAVTSNTATVVVNAATSISTQPVSPGAVCQNSVLSPLSVAATGTGTLTYQWYSNTTNSNTGGTSIGSATTNSYLPGTSSAGTIYLYAVVTGTCGSATTNAVTLTVNPNPTVTSAASAAICSGFAQNYLITSGVGGATFTWSRAAVTGVTNTAVTGQTGNPITESLINTSSAPVDVTYAIVPSASGCTGPSFNYVVTVNPTPAMTSAAAGTICSGVAQNYTLTSNVSGATYSWSRAAVVGISNTALTGQSTNPITEALVNTTSAPVDVTYALTPTANGCPGATFNYVVTVNAASVGGTVASPQTVCIGSAPSSSIVLSGNTGSVVKWQKAGDAAFTSPSDIAITSATLSNISMGQLTQNTYFRAVVQSASCAAANSASVLMTVNSTVDNTTALAGTAGGGQVCATYDVAASNNYMNNCNLIATVAPRAGTPISGVVNACVMVEAGVLTAPNGQPYVARHFDILPATNRTTATSTMTLYFKQAEFTAYNAARGVYPALPTGSGDATGIANLRVTLFNTNGVGTSFATYPALSGKAIVPTSVTYNATADRWSVVFDATGSGAVYVHTGAFALPVTLVSFKGEQSGEINKLTWSTATETNNKGFELERSLDGIKFTSIAFVASKGDNGNSSVNLDYGYNDKAVVGITYYRLKQVDRDGKYNYSNVVTLTRKGSEIVLSSVYPNPATSELNLKITSPRAEKLTIVVTDLTGKVVMQRAASVATGDNIATMNVSALAAGSYIIKAVCANGCETAVHKFVKQ